MTESIDITEDEELDEPEVYEWTPYCWDDCETCDPTEPWAVDGYDEEEDD